MVPVSLQIYSLYLIKLEFDKMGLLEFSGEELTHTFLSENGNSIKWEFLVSPTDFWKWTELCRKYTSFLKLAHLAWETKNSVQIKSRLFSFCVTKNLSKRLIRESSWPTLFCSKMGIRKNGSPLVPLTHTCFKNGIPFYQIRTVI